MNNPTESDLEPSKNEDKETSSSSEEEKEELLNKKETYGTDSTKGKESEKDAKIREMLRRGEGYSSMYGIKSAFSINKEISSAKQNWEESFFFKPNTTCFFILFGCLLWAAVCVVLVTVPSVVGLVLVASRNTTLDAQ